ncbi:MAG: SDR family oxidoreductase [Planctomyces sp.]|nr:SDR family oxidoreductase [Planctomyces sp.]
MKTVGVDPVFAGKTAVVTGASRGIGLGIAKALLHGGCQVSICSRKQDDLTAVQSSIEAGSNLLAVAADVGREADVQRLFDETIDHFGKIDILVNNAGNFDGGPIDQLTLNDWQNVMDACLTGPFLCTREAFRHMKGLGGRILNIGSISAQRPRLFSVPYTSAKFGVWGLTQAAALEGRDYGITVCCLHPGNVLVERRQNSDSDSDKEPMMSVDTIVRAAVTMLSMPPDVNFLEAIVLPSEQLYVGRG